MDVSSLTSGQSQGVKQAAQAELEKQAAAAAEAAAQKGLDASDLEIANGGERRGELEKNAAAAAAEAEAAAKADGQKASDDPKQESMNAGGRRSLLQKQDAGAETHAGKGSDDDSLGESMHTGRKGFRNGGMLDMYMARSKGGVLDEHIHTHMRMNMAGGRGNSREGGSTSGSASENVMQGDQRVYRRQGGLSDQERLGMHAYVWVCVCI